LFALGTNRLKQSPPTWTRVLLFASLAMLSFATVCRAEKTVSPAAALSYSRHVRPILSNNCFACHGPDEEDRQADVRLDVPGEADLEAMFERITSNDPEVMMPPPDSHKKLSAGQIETLKQWIAEDAPYEEHWAFVTPQNQDMPLPEAISLPENGEWSNQPIDRFVLARLQQADLLPSPQASKRSLIRRVTFDLTGLPPTLEEIQAFLDDSSDRAYENLVERLLASPQYGEHMARYWLDLVRFADTNGLHHDHYREMTPYRDWVIRSFNENLAFDQFITYQLAGDLFDEPSIDQQIASGFNRLHLIIDRGTALPEESFMRNVVDRVTSVGTAFLGLTVQCAVCHDHKYDPITQQDFYQLYAFFNNFDGGPETGGRKGLDFNRGLQPPYLNLPSPSQKEELKLLDGEIAELEAQIKAAEAFLAKQPEDSSEEKKTAVDEGAVDKNTPDNKQEELSAELEQKQTARAALLTAIPVTLVMKERVEPRPAHIHIRGAYDQLGERVERNTPSFLPPMKEKSGIKTRMDFAKWLVEPSHPLTARVAVNRFWQQLFGVGLVKTSEDFGAQGEWPSHPKLLDHLTRRFIESGWEVKSLVRSIVLSQTYQQSSQAAPEEYVSDPKNRLLARGSRYRLDAEMIRDQILSVCGQLNPAMYGKSVKPPQPDGLWKIVAMPSSYPRIYEADKGDQIYRRSVYTFWKRGLPPPQMTIFDAPSRESCIARRERTNTPLQALLLMNEEQYFDAAMQFATSLLGTSNLNEEQRIRQAYETITSQVPTDATLSQLKDALLEFHNVYTADPTSAQAMITHSKNAEIQAITDPEQQADVAAWTMLVHSLLNLDATRNRE